MNGTDPQTNNYSDFNSIRTRYNCFDNATSSDMKKVIAECDTHAAAVPQLDCENFYNTVVFQNQWSPCPVGQYKLPNTTADNPCVCGYPGGPPSSGPPSLFGPVAAPPSSGPPSLFGPVAEPLSGKGSSVQVGAVVGGVVGLVVAFCIIVGLVIWKCRGQFSWLDRFKPARQGEGNILFFHYDKQQVKTGLGQPNKEIGLGCANLGDWDPPQGFQRFTLAELARITDNFNDSKLLGAGGFGKVFLGTLEDGRTVAIKRPSLNSVQGVGEFRNEVELLSRLHHRHLVRLEGFCQEEGLEILVYEYMINGNLHAHLLGKVTRTPLHWYKRLEIAVAVAQGLEYLHNYADPPVIHRDLKPSNILLDENMIAKLADFGTPKATAEFDTHISTRPAGTAGYLDPQYFMRRQLTTASDVYAFGVVLLELVTGQQAIDNSRVEEFNLVVWVRQRFQTSGVEAIINPLIDGEYPQHAFSAMTHLALRCASFKTEKRPNMKEVLSNLEPFLVEYAEYIVPQKSWLKHQLKVCAYDDFSYSSFTSGSDFYTHASYPTDQSVESPSTSILSTSSSSHMSLR